MFTDLCDVSKLIKKYVAEMDCNEPYSIFNEDQKDYGLGWQPLQVRAGVHTP